MREGSVVTQLILGVIFILQVSSKPLHDQPLGENSGVQLRKLLQEEDSFEPSGVLDLSDVDLSAVQPVSGVPISFPNPYNPLANDTENGSVSAFDRWNFIFASIIGVDKRQRVYNTYPLPFKSIGQIGSYCTGTVVGPRHVLTAAHCLVDPYSAQTFSPITFTPTRNGIIDPFGTYETENIFVPDEYIDGREDFFQYDYGIIILKKPFGSDVAPLKIDSPCENTRNYVLNIIGYPVDKKSGTQWASACAAVRMDCEWRTFRHSCDTFSGMSGSAMLTVRQGTQGTDYLIRGIHSAGTKKGQIFNIGTIITQEIQQQINRVIQNTT